MTGLVDAHAHITRGIRLREVLDRMDAAGVSTAVVMAREVDERRILELRRLAPTRIVPFMGGRLIQAAFQRGSYRSNRRGVRHYRGFRDDWWRKRGESVFHKLEEALDSRRFGGIGEIRLKHRGFGPSVPEMKCDYDFEFDHPVPLRLLELAGARGLPVTVHLEIDEDRDRRLRAFSRALKLRARTKVIWAHSGPADPSTLGRMLSGHGNLLAEIMPLLRNTYAARVPYLKTFPPVANSGARLFPAWKRLFERHADRFLVGSDCRTAAEYRHLRIRMEDMRAILSQLSGRAAARIGAANARALFSAYRSF